MAFYIQKKLEMSNCACHILIAHTQAEAETILSENKGLITLCLTDLNLPDAPDGESVDLLAKHGITTVVFTSSYNDAIRERMYKKRVADYVIKDGEASIDYAISSIKQLLQNNGSTIWIVAPFSSASAQQILGLLSIQRYNLKSFASFQDLLYALDRHTPDLILIEDALNIKDQDVFKTVSTIRRKHPSSELPIISCESTQNLSIAIKLMKYGINDFFNTGFTAEELYIRVRQGIDQSNAYKEIQRISQTDHLTHLNNRRHFFTLAGAQLQKNLAQDKLNFVIMADIDHFKRVNDTYGHQKGDEAIVFTANLINQIFHEHIVARFGGEEFCIFGTAEDKESIMTLCEHLQTRIDKESYTMVQVNFTLSQGICFGGKTLEKLIDRADQALYLSKQNGRNQINVYANTAEIKL